MTRYATFQLLHEPALRLTIIIDHLRALAAATDAPGVTASIATLVRPALESLGSLYWLYDPTIDTRERVRRRCNFRLASLREQWAIAASVGGEQMRAAATADVEAKMASIEAGAQSHGYKVVKAKQRYDNQLGAHYLDPRPPSDGQLIDGPLEGGDAARLGRLVHRLTSAVIHGQAHALLPTS